MRIAQLNGKAQGWRENARICWLEFLKSRLDQLNSELLISCLPLAQIHFKGQHSVNCYLILNDEFTASLVRNLPQSILEVLLLEHVRRDQNFCRLFLK